MKHKELTHQRNIILLTLIGVFYSIQVLINILIEGWASVFPPAFLFIVAGIMLSIFIFKKVNPEITMYLMVTYIYLYFYFLLIDSPYLVNYLFMWLGLPLSSIYLNYRVVLLAGTASLLITFYAFFYLHEDIFPNVVQEDFIYLVLFGVFSIVFLITFIRIILRLWEQANEANAKLQELAYHDPLTGAANRLLLKETFDRFRENQVQSLAILFIDMNNFKSVNDTYGHEIGDRLLGKVVSRLKDHLHHPELLCRLGGDEFVILLSDVDNSRVEIVLEKVQTALAEPFMVDDRTIYVSASIGSSYRSEVFQADLEEMIREADIAMYAEKGKRKVN